MFSKLKNNNKVGVIAMSRQVMAVLALLATLCGAARLPAQEATPGSQWLSYNNRLDGVRFSPLKQITAANVAQLGEVCRVQIDGPTAFHAGLIVADGVIYTTTGRETYALDAATCAVRWKFDYRAEEERCGGTNRGVAVMDGRVFRGTCDGRLIALDARNGSLLWKTEIAAVRLGEGTSAAPLAWGGMVFMGISGSELGVRGRVMAYDAATGRELWRFHTIPMGKDVGAETWERPESAKTGGGGVWGAMTLDITTGELFVPVGNPWPDIDKAYRPGANLFTDSIVVLDARTGALRWWHQVTAEDWMDLDMVAPPVLYRASKVRDLLVFGGKDGYVTGVDRDTRAQVFRVPVTTVQKIPKMPTREGMKMCPGYAGGVEWNGPALDRLNNQLVTGAVDACFLVKLGTTEYQPGGVSFGGSVEPVGETSGWITAIDAETGAVRWKYHAEKPVVAGVTPTAGGITFAGDLAGNLLVFDSKTGKVVHKAKAGGAMAAGLVTYELGGRQYVAFGAGNISRNAFGDLGLPSVVIMTLNPGRPATALDATGVARPGGVRGAPDVAAGRRLYSQVCSACHGPDGNMIADRKLSNLRARRDVASTIAYIKDPKPPMPRMYPDLLGEQSIVDVTAYIHEELK
jgi:PQQ-dependent dehydrogenase (methanol/ethanol family)